MKHRALHFFMSRQIPAYPTPYITKSAEIQFAKILPIQLLVIHRGMIQFPMLVQQLAMVCLKKKYYFYTQK